MSMKTKRWPVDERASTHTTRQLYRRGEWVGGCPGRSEKRIKISLLTQWQLKQVTVNKTKTLKHTTTTKMAIKVIIERSTKNKTARIEKPNEMKKPNKDIVNSL